MLRGAVATLIAIAVVGGCGTPPPPTRAPTAAAFESAVPSRPDATPASTAQPTDPPTPSPSPIPSPPADLPTRLVKSKSGIRVTIELDRNPLRAGDPTWATMTVQNRGSTDATWYHDGCAIPVGLGGEIVGTRWRPGVEQSGQAALFKARVVEASGGDVPWIQFIHERYIGKVGFGCADLGVTDTIPPGDSLVHRARWDGMASPALGPPPGGAVELTGRAAYYFRGKQPARLITTAVIELRATAWIVDGKDPTLLDPPEIIDAALADEDFAAWLADKELGNGRNEFIRFDPEAGLWEVGTVEYVSNRLHFVRVDPMGRVLDTIDRPWDPRTDGNL
jgi:hypothetical protein